MRFTPQDLVQLSGSSRVWARPGYINPTNLTVCLSGPCPELRYRETNDGWLYNKVTSFLSGWSGGIVPETGPPDEGAKTTGLIAGLIPGPGLARHVFMDVGERVGGAIGRKKATKGRVGLNGKSLWTSGSQGGVRNALRHFRDHGAEFSAKNALDYVRQTHRFLHSPPRSTLTRVRPNGDVVRYDPASNTFGVMDKYGAPRTMFKPDPAKHGYPTNRDYFDAQ